MSKPGKTVLITGASKGLGRSLALAFAASGHHVVAHGRDESRLNTVKREIQAHGVDCHAIIGDISDEETIRALTACAEKVDVDILINNAGIYLRKPIKEMSPEELRGILEVNLIAPILLTKAILELFERKSSGLIININSVAGKNPGLFESAYCASKHGLRGFMGSLKFETLKYDVPIVDIYLGAMNTDMAAERKDAAKHIRTEEVAELVSKIAQDYSSMRISEIDILRRIY